MKIATAAQMQAIDARTIDEIGIPGCVLMERAGLAVCRVIADRFPGADQAFVVCGGGNNGGDGFVVARELAGRGCSVRTVLLAEPDRLKGDALHNFRVNERLGIPCRIVRKASELRLKPMTERTVVVDAVFGTGLAREVEGLYATALKRMNDSGAAVVAVDIPSGLSADTGRLLGTAVRATETVTFGLPKRGHLLYPGPIYTGRLTVADIGFPPQAVEAETIPLSVLTAATAGRGLPPRPPDGHKGTFGHLLVVAGSRGKAGAASLVGRAALRTGAGLVTLAMPESLAGAVTRRDPELMTLPLPETSAGTISARAVGLLRDAASRADALALGPGLSVDGETMALVRKLLRSVRRKTVLDADGINTLMGDAAFLGTLRQPILLTPHPAEFGRLIEAETLAVQADRVGMTENFIRRFPHILALKGAHTLVGSRSEGIALNLTGNAGMATAGSGDVLTGIAGALLAAGSSLAGAARSSVYVHGLAADLAAARKSERSLTARDIIATLPEAFRRLESGPHPSGPPERLRPW